jgi:hypothetical protein
MMCGCVQEEKLKSDTTAMLGAVSNMLMTVATPGVRAVSPVVTSMTPASPAVRVMSPVPTVKDLSQASRPTLFTDNLPLQQPVVVVTDDLPPTVTSKHLALDRLIICQVDSVSQCKQHSTARIFTMLYNKVLAGENVHCSR